MSPKRIWTKKMWHICICSISELVNNSNCYLSLLILLFFVIVAVIDFSFFHLIPCWVESTSPVSSASVTISFLHFLGLVQWLFTLDRSHLSLRDLALHCFPLLSSSSSSSSNLLFSVSCSYVSPLSLTVVCPVQSLPSGLCHNSKLRVQPTYGQHAVEPTGTSQQTTIYRMTICGQNNTVTPAAQTARLWLTITANPISQR